MLILKLTKNYVKINIVLRLFMKKQKMSMKNLYKYFFIIY